MKANDGKVLVADYLAAKGVCSVALTEDECVKADAAKDKEVRGIDGDLKCEWTIKPQDYHRSVNRIFYDPKATLTGSIFKKTCAAATEKGFKTEVSLG